MTGFVPFASRCGLLVAASVALLGCQGEEAAGSDGSCDGAKCDAPDDDGTADADRRMCFGVRGNGQLIFAHFGSLARIYETYGLMWGSRGEAPVASPRS